MTKVNVTFEADHEKDHHEDSENKIHLQGFDESTENTVKKVKEAIANREGCRVRIPLIKS